MRLNLVCATDFFVLDLKNEFDENTRQTIRASVLVFSFRILPQYPVKISDRKNGEIPKSPRQKSKENKYYAILSPKINTRLKRRSRQLGKHGEIAFTYFYTVYLP